MRWWLLILLVGCSGSSERDVVVEAAAEVSTVDVVPEVDPPSPTLSLGAAQLPLLITPAGTVSATEVTNAAFRVYRPGHTSNRYQRRELYEGMEFDRDAQPAVVTWMEASAFCRWASRTTGQTVRLPTEAEWEQFARAGSTTDWSFGDDPSIAHHHANGNDPTTFERLVKGDDAYPQDDRMGDDGVVGTADVGSFAPNAWGLHDVHGNVAEWCSDAYGEDGPPEGVSDDDPSAARVWRGGGWNNGPELMKSSSRNYCFANNHYDALGFRVVVEAAPTP